MPDTINCSSFAQLLVDQEPHYDKEILETVRPTDGSWVGHVSIDEPFPAGEGTTLYQDRFESVFPNTTKPFTQVSYASCVGNPCATNENQIGWGSTRRSFFLEKQSWATPLICFDQTMHVSHAKQQYSQIINKILAPASKDISSMFLRKRALYWADKKYVATANFGTTAAEFSYIWEDDADGNEIYLLTSLLPTSKLTPQMLQRQVEPLIREGYFGQTPFEDKDAPPMIELVTSMSTVWELERLGGSQGVGGGGNPSIQGNWRFTDFGAVNKYWKYGFTGQIGNYAVRSDPFELRFNLVTENSGNDTYPYKFQLVLPYKNIASSGAGGAAGLKSTVNTDFDNAQYRISFIWHKKAMALMPMEKTTINPEMPFGARDYAGKWQFVLPHVCVQPDGTTTVIDNRRKNYGQFIADFKMAIRPRYTEYAQALFHKAEPACVIVVDTCNSDPGYPSQLYDSANTPCEE